MTGEEQPGLEELKDPCGNGDSTAPGAPSDHVGGRERMEHVWGQQALGSL